MHSLNCIQQKEMEEKGKRSQRKSIYFSAIINGGSGLRGNIIWGFDSKVPSPNKASSFKEISLIFI